MASGTSVLGVGTDIGGSIRVPAAFCGVCGLKPTAHRWSNLGSSTAIAGQETIRSQIGPMARSVADLRLLWESLSPLEMAKRDPLVPPIAASGPEPGLPAGLRVGFYVDDGFLTPAASVQRGVREAVAALEAAGIEAIPYRPSNAEELTYLYFQVLSSDGGATLERILAGEPMIPSLQQLRRIARLPAIARRALAELMERRGERRVAELLRSLGRKGVERLWELTARRSEMLREEMAAWDAAGIDALVTPPFATTAAPLGAAHDFTIGFCYAARFNVLNLPAGVVPISTVRPSEIARPLRGDRLDRRVAAIEGQSLGLPLSAQIVTRPYQEELALALMGAVEAQLRATGAQPQTPIDPR
ncbi:MAG: amidase [Myxococcales bacterium]|nr:amidase [Myxococcales bacterium]